MGVRRGAVRFDHKAVGLFRQGEGGEAQGEVGIVFEVVANGWSIEDQGIGLLINQQLNGAPEVGGANDPHVAALGQLRATGALHHSNPMPVQLCRSADA